jgi:hypothetical protein
MRKSEKKEGGMIGRGKDGSSAKIPILLFLIEKTERSDIHKSSIFNLQFQFGYYLFIAASMTTPIITMNRVTPLPDPARAK